MQDVVSVSITPVDNQPGVENLLAEKLSGIKEELQGNLLHFGVHPVSNNGVVNGYEIIKVSVAEQEG